MEGGGEAGSTGMGHREELDLIIQIMQELKGGVFFWEESKAGLPPVSCSSHT